MEAPIKSTQTGSQQTPYLSVVIPAYNEERRLPPTLDRLRAYLSRQSYGWEVIVVSNGCTDRTEAVVQHAALTMPNLRLISLEQRGKGIAVKTGALASHGSVVFLCDADLSMPPEELSLFLDLIDTFDVVVGSREAPGAHRYDEPWTRHFMGRVFNWVVQTLAVPGIDDTQCGFKAFTRKAALDVFGQQILTGFGFDVEVLYLSRKYGYSMNELAIDWYFDPDTRVRPGVDSIFMVGEVLKMLMRAALGRYRLPATAASAAGDDGA